MTFCDKKQKLDYLIKLISNESTGNADTLCENINVSKPTLMRYLADLRELGYLIGYCRYRRSYCIFQKKSNFIEN